MSKTYRVIYVGGSEGFQAAEKVLSNIAQVVHVASDSGDLYQALIDADALLDASMKVRITDTMIGSAKGLKVISCATTGSDHIDRKSALSRKISVFTLKEDRDLLNNITPAAELSWALLMACARQLVPAIEHVRSGQWVREEFPSIMLNGKQLGIIGCGRIGSWMANYANAFGMTVVGFDPYLSQFPNNIRPTPLKEIFEQSQFVSVHVHLSEETKLLVSADLIASANPGLILINTSRGPVVDQDALLSALKSGRIGGAGLDVLTGEPEIESHPLVNYAKSHNNLLITPHCGGYSPDALKVVCAHAAKKIAATLTAAS